MIYKNKIYDFLLFCGDIHGEINVIPDFIKHYDIKNAAIFQLGDFGIGFETKEKENKRLKYLNERLKRSDSDLFVIRGNHDDPSYFTSNQEYNNLLLLKDYEVICINGWNILGIGGATSIDRTNRRNYWYKKGRDYWKDEEIVLKEDILKEMYDIDIVCTHSAPNFCPPFTKDNIHEWIKRDSELSSDIAVERHNLTMIYEILSKNNNISDWYYGHFHFNQKTHIGNTTFHALDINKIEENIKVCKNVL